MFTGIVEELGIVAAVTEHGAAAGAPPGGAAGSAPEAAELVIGCSDVLADVRLGASIAVNGVCLTVTSFSPPGETDPRTGTRVFTADVMLETLRRSALGGLAAGDRVNLERPVRLADRLGGHLVQGHVDGVGTIVGREPAEHWEVVRIALPAGLDRYLVEKGSVAVDGVSLTVVDVLPARPPGQSPRDHGEASRGRRPVDAGQSPRDHGEASRGRRPVGELAGEPAAFTVSLIPTTLAETTLGARPVGAAVNLEVDVVAKYVEKLAAPALGRPAAAGEASPAAVAALLGVAPLPDAGTTVVGANGAAR